MDQEWWGGGGHERIWVEGIMTVSWVCCALLYMWCLAVFVIDRSISAV